MEEVYSSYPNTSFFTVGPSAIYPKLAFWTQQYYDSGFGSISHRSKDFENMYRFLDLQLRELMNIPDTHAIWIGSSGSEWMERILQNGVKRHSFHFVQGAFSEKFYRYAQRIGLDAKKSEILAGKSFDFIPTIPQETELICITHNETSTGIKLSEDWIHDVKEQYPEKLLVVDTVSSAPFFNLDISKIDMCFFSSQKAFGLPAGLGILIINKKVAEHLAVLELYKGRSAHNIFADYIRHSENFQTPSTPNTLGVFLMGKVAEDMNQIGREELFRVLRKHKLQIQSAIDKSEFLRLAYSDNPLLSDTVIVADCIMNQLDILHHLRKNGIICSTGYGGKKSTQLRFSNFPANQDTDIEKLVKAL